jgi:hypothetical protein
VTLAVCIRCGHIKRGPAAKCAACHFQPRAAEDKAKSLILSLDYELQDEYFGKTKDELQVVATAIAKGQPYGFDDAEVRSVVEYAERVRHELSAKRLAIDGLRWLLPPILILVVLYVLLFWKT